MKSSIQFVIHLAAFLALLSQTSAQDEKRSENDSDKGKPAIVTFVNACETQLDKRWKASLDFRIGSEIVARDIRVGERSPAFTFDEKASQVAALRHGTVDAGVFASIIFEEDTHFTMVATGMLGKNSKDMQLHIVSDKDLQFDNNDTRSHVILFNAISSYDISISVDSKMKKLDPLHKVLIHPPPGEHEFNIHFPLKDGAIGTIRSALISEARAKYIIIIHGSSERGDRPTIFRASSIADRQDINDRKLAIEIEMAGSDN